MEGSTEGGVNRVPPTTFPDFERYRIAVVNRHSQERFELIDTNTGQPVKTYRSLAHARSDQQFLNDHDAALRHRTLRVAAQRDDRNERSTGRRPSA
jgi:hypothetical protein